VYYVSTWQTPIDVALPVDGSDGWSLDTGITYGLVSTELVEAEWPSGEFPARLVDRLGLRALLDTSRAFDYRASTGNDDADPDIRALANRLHEIVRHEFAPLTAPILESAKASQSLEVEPDRGVRRLVHVYGPRTTAPRRLRRDQRTLWGPSFAHILERAAVEVFELYASHARVRRCIYCGSVFVPRRDERFCQWNLWPWPAEAGDLALRLCSPQRQARVGGRVGLSDDEAYRRERRRLWMKADREEKAALKAGLDPDKNPRVAQARKAHRRFVLENGRVPGRKPKNDEAPDIVEASGE
jgi:hypothetical protein